MNSFRRITKLHHVADTSSVAFIITRSVDDRFGCTCSDCEINGMTAPSTGVWGYFPLVTTDPNAITPSIHTGPHVADRVLGRVSPIAGRLRWFVACPATSWTLCTGP